MATFRIEVSTHQRKDETYPIYIRVTHKQKLRRIKTEMVAYPADLNRDHKLKMGNLRRKCEELILKLYSAQNDISVFDMPRANVDFIASTVRETVMDEDWQMNFFTFAEEYIEKASITESTKHTYHVAISALARYVGSRNLDINDITLPFLEDFVHFLDNEPKYHYDRKLKKTVATKQAKRPGTGAKAYLTKLGTIFNAAKRRYNDDDQGRIHIPRSPFEKISVKASPSEGQSPLSLKVVRLMIASTPTKESERNAIDLFLLSLGLMGPNMADLYEATKPSNEQWNYRRKKTTRRRADKAQMRIMIPDCLIPYITRQSRGAAAGKWLNLSRRFETADYATQGTNKALKSWATANGLPEFTFYAARKTWATIAGSKECNIDKALIDECLVHVGQFKMADIYIQKDWERIWDANQKVCDFIWGETYA
jgi:integrase